MTAVVESSRNVALIGELKFISIQSDATCATGHTIDLNSDATTAAINTIRNTLVQDDAGADVTSTWDPATGIITLGTITTGIHNILIVGV
jgi:hypothetical protein